MIKFTARVKNSRILVGLGLTDENIARLKEGKPIHIHSEEVNFPGYELMIFHGKDEAAIQEDLKSLIGPDTIIREGKLE